MEELQRVLLKFLAWYELLLLFFLAYGYCSPAEEVGVLCDIYLHNHPSLWLTSPCLWTTPCQQYLNGINCTQDTVCSMYLGFCAYVAFNRCFRDLSSQSMTGLLPDLSLLSGLQYLQVLFL